MATFAGSDPASLYFLDNPLRMIDGEIRPPSCHLDAVEVLRRQFLAYLLDRIASREIDAPSMPRDVVEVLGKNAVSNPNPTWLSSAVIAARMQPQLLDRFLGLFGDALSTEVVAAMGDFASIGLERAVKESAGRWQEELADLERRRDRLSNRIKALDAQSVRDPDQEDDLRALRGERAVIGSRITKHRREYTLAALERVGLLPSYSLTDDSVELDAVLWSVDEDGERTPHQTSFTRPAHYAIREFAPGNTYYSQGHRFVVDALDVGTGNEPLFETWRLCPECGFGTTDAGTTWTVCPRCSSASIADLGAQHKLLPVRRVLCIDSEEKARVFDETDERDRERYDEIVSVDVDPVNVVTAFALTNATFGVELARSARVRFLNLGRVERPGAPARVAGRDVNASRFKTCVHCGVVEGARPLGAAATTRHLGWCRTRSGTVEKWESLLLSHELGTDVVRMLVPVAAVETADRLATFKAILRIGLRVSFGGDPDHLQAVASDMPAGVGAQVAAGGSRRNFVVLYDTIPGGTGYLDRLAVPDKLRLILESARDLIASCSCAEEGLQACHRCLLGVADRREIPLVTRSLALEQLDELLREWNPEFVATIATLGVEQLEESELERLFRSSLVAWDARRDDVMIVEAPGGRQNGYELRFDGDGAQAGAKAVRWRIREQVDVSLPGVSCRPDFLLTRVDGAPIEVAVFTDGERFHASAETNRIADDADKRQALLDSGRLVWSLTWQDVQSFHDALTSSTPKNPPMNGLLDDASRSALATLAQKLGLRLSPRIASMNPVEQLLTFLSSPDVDDWEALACATVSARLVGGVTRHSVDDAKAIVVGALTGKPIAPSVVSDGLLLAGRFGTVTAVLDGRGSGISNSRWTVVNVLNDESGVGTELGRELWRHWLSWGNLAQFLRTSDRQYRMAAISQAASIDLEALYVLAGATEPLVHEPAGLLVLDAENLALLDEPIRLRLVEASTLGLEVEPEYGYEPDDPQQRGWQLDCAWTDSGFALVADLDPERDAWLSGLGWSVLSPKQCSAQTLVERTRRVR